MVARIKSFEQELKEKKLKYFIKSKMNVSRYFGINVKNKIIRALKQNRCTKAIFQIVSR